MLETYTAQVLPLVSAFIFGVGIGCAFAIWYIKRKIKNTISGIVSPFMDIAATMMPLSSNLCHDCGADIDEIHADGCDVERCSVCGGQRLQCDCEGHDEHASRWTGEFPHE